MILNFGLFWGCIQQENTTTPFTNRIEEQSIASATELSLTTTLPKIQATELWERVPIVQISPDGIYIESQKLISLSKWDVITPEQRKGALLPSLYDHLINKIDHKESLHTSKELAFPFARRLLIAAHPKAPFRLVRNVLFTAGQAQFGQFGFLVEDPRGNNIVQELEQERPLFLPPFTPIYNTTPLLQKVQIPSQVSVGESIICQPYNIYDAEQDLVSFKYKWIVNGIQIDNINKSMVPDKVNDTIQCQIIATDGMSESKIYSSNVATVNDKEVKENDNVNTLWPTALKEVYPNCISQYRLTLDSMSPILLPTSDEKDIYLRGVSDAKIFQEWTKKHHSNSIAGHNRLFILLSSSQPLDWLLTFSSIWSSYDGSVTFPASSDIVGESWEEQPVKNTPSVIKPINKKYPVVAIQLPIIREPMNYEAAINCIGKDGKRVINQEGWSCSTLGKNIDCMSTSEVSQEKSNSRSSSSTLRHEDQQVFSIEQSCLQDDDCILVNQNCCSCNSGGEQVAINKQYEQDIADRRAIICSSMGCLTFINEAPVCVATDARCEQGTCRVNIPN